MGDSEIDTRLNGGIGKASPRAVSSNHSVRRTRDYFLKVLCAVLIVGVCSAIPGPYGQFRFHTDAEGLVLDFANPTILRTRDIPFEGWILRDLQGIDKLINELSNSPVLEGATAVSFGEHSRLSSLGFAENAVITFEASDHRLNVTVRGVSRVVVTPNRGRICTMHRYSRACTSSDELHNVVGIMGAESSLSFTRDPRVGTRGGVRGDKILQHFGEIRLVSFDVPIGEEGRPTSAGNLLLNGVLEFLSYGQETEKVGFGQSLRIGNANGRFQISTKDGVLETSFHGDVASLSNASGQDYRPSLLAWLWRNPTISLFTTAVFGLVAFIGIAFSRKKERE